MNNDAIGVFDSGIGGLTTVKELNRLLPNEKIIYLGDTARVPYGARSRETVITSYSIHYTKLYELRARIRSSLTVKHQQTATRTS